MRIRRTARVVTNYVLSLLATIVLLVVWVVYVVRSVARIREVAGRVGLSNPNTHWILLGVGCALFFLLIAGLTYQLAQVLAASRQSQQQEEFLSNVTHELRSPLAAIKLHAQTLEDAALSLEQQRRSVRFILQQVERMAKLVDDVLESSRLQVRRQRLTLEPTALAEFFAGYFPEAAARLERQGLELKWQVEGEATVLASPDALTRVLDNLLDNAARFSRGGGEVRSRVTTADGHARIEVEDDGAGIPRKELGKIFDRFYQVAAGEGGRPTGSGLGLSIVAGLVREMGGSVSAFSQEGRPGARFLVELPITGGAP